MRKLHLMAPVAVVAALVVAACGGGDEPTPTPGVAASVSATESTTPAESADAAMGDTSSGQKIFAQTCIACHGVDAKGIKGLGKDLTTSEFVAGLDDTGLVEFIKKGHDPSDPLNTTGVAMPPKAGNPAISDQQLFDVVAYVRTLHTAK